MEMIKEALSEWVIIPFVVVIVVPLVIWWTIRKREKEDNKPAN